VNQLTENKFLSDQELQGLLKMCNRHRGKRDSIMIRFALFTGARGCEILQVRKSDLNQGAVSLVGAKGSNNRTMPLPDDFYEELIEYCNNQQDEEFLFPVAIRTFRWIWDKWRPNTKLGLHSLRHTFGVKLYMNCKDIHAVKTALGHRSIGNTQIYVDFVESQQRLKEVTEGMWGKAS